MSLVFYDEPYYAVAIKVTGVSRSARIEIGELVKVVGVESEWENELAFIKEDEFETYDRGGASWWGDADNFERIELLEGEDG